MDSRERLTDLLECEENGVYRHLAEAEADYLLANGVTIPVHCKDCKHRYLLVCSIFKRQMHDECFCCYGERKDNE